MLSFLMSKTDAAQFVGDILQLSPRDWPSITITIRGKSEVCFVSIAIDMLSDEIAETMVQLVLKQPTTTLLKITPVG